MEYDRERNLDPNRDPNMDPSTDPNRNPSLHPNGEPTYDPNAQPSQGGNRDIEQGDNYDQGGQQGQTPSALDKMKGKMQEGAGKLTGNDDMEAEGRMQQEGGTADQGWDPGTRGGNVDRDQ